MLSLQPARAALRPIYANVSRFVEPTRPPWTCSKCSQSSPQLLRSGAFRTYARSHVDESLNHARIRMNKIKRRTGLITFASIALLGYAALEYTEQGRFVKGGVVRSGRVVVTLVRCTNAYRRTLNKRADLSKEDFEAELKACHQTCANLTFEAMQANGSVFIKLGQHLSSLNYLLPAEWCDTFIPLQDRCPVSSFESVKALIQQDTGGRFDELFTSFDEKPLGAASLAQVHKATLRSTGEVVAVKIQHPVLDYWAPLDMFLTSSTFKLLKRAFPEYDLTWLSEEMEASLPQELDFAKEGENAIAAKKYFSNISAKKCPLVIPEVIESHRRMLIMQYLTGHRPDDLRALRSSHISRDEVAAALARIFNTMIFSPGAPLHCDPHGGNLAIRPNKSRAYPHNFDIVLYDHGLYRWIDLELQRNYAHLWLAVIDTNLDDMRVYANKVAGITDSEFPLFASAITGRDYMTLTEGVHQRRRDDAERKRITDALQGGLLPQLVQLLAKVPRIILLILKTNDLTRSLDTNLHTTQGPMRAFLILARYAAQTVYDESVERLRQTGGLLWPPRHAASFVVAWTKFTQVKFSLYVYEWYLFARGIVGLSNDVQNGLDALQSQE